MKTIMVEISTPNELDPVEWFQEMTAEMWYAKRHSLENNLLDEVEYRILDEK